jgi:hypothetical protein
VRGVACVLALSIATAFAPSSRGAPFPAEFELASLYPAQGGDGTAGFVLGGVHETQDTGFSVRSAGDVNGDGIDDLVIGAPPENLGGRDRGGEVFVVFGRDTAKSGNFPALLPLAALLPERGGDGSVGFVIRAVDWQDYVGFDVSDAGDVNHDGVDDLVLGAPRANPGESSVGESYLVFGRDTAQAGPFPAVFDLERLLPGFGGDGSAGVVMPGRPDSTFSGEVVSAAGDVNADGIDDVIIGASNVSLADRNSAGQCYVVYGRDTMQSRGFPPRLPLASLLPANGGDGTLGFVLNGAVAASHACSSASDAGDVNGDGIADLVIGAPGAYPNNQAFVLFGRDADQAGPFPAEFPLGSLTRPGGGDGTAGFVANGDYYSDGTGWSVGGVGDLNGDGIDDFAVGARDLTVGSRSQLGRVYVVFGRDTAETGPFPAVLPLTALLPAYGGDGSRGFALTGFIENGAMGVTLSDAGDVNGDGIGDLILGSWEDQSYVIYGRDTAGAGNFPAHIFLASLLSRFGGDGSVGFVIHGGNIAAGGVSAAGDVNHDGIDDLVVGAPGLGHARRNGGGAFIVFGRREAPDE